MACTSFRRARDKRRQLFDDPARDIALRIFHVVESYAAGTLASVNLLVNGLAARGHEVWLLHGSRLNGPELPGTLLHPSVRLLRFDVGRQLEPIRDLRATVALAQLLHRENPDIVHLHSAKAGFIGRMAARATNTPAFYSPRGLAFNQPDIGPIRRSLYYLLEAAVARVGGTTSVACSEDESELLRKFAAPVECINNGIELPLLLELAARHRPPQFRLRVPGEPLVVVALGRTDAVKRPELFEAIAQELAHTEPGRFRFLWIGDGPYRFRPAGSVEHLGWLDRQQALEVLAREADILLQTSVSEGMPLAVLEAKALGVPAIVPNVTGNRCAVTPGVSGYIVDSELPHAFAAALSRIASKPALLKQLAAQAREEAQLSFSSERVLEQWLALYRSALQRQHTE